MDVAQRIASWLTAKEEQWCNQTGAYHIEAVARARLPGFAPLWRCPGPGD